MKATAGGRLVLFDGNYDNAGGVIEATGADAIVGLRSLVCITGGTLLADGLMGVSVGDGEFENDGIVSVLPRSGVVFVGTTIRNYDAATGRLAGGEWRAKSKPNEAASISLPSGVAVTCTDAKIVLDGPQAFFDAINPLATIELNGYFDVTGGRVFDTAGDLTNSGHVHVGADSVINVNGTYVETPTGYHSGEGQINAQDVLISGTLSPGDSIGTLHFNRLTLLDGARIELEIDGSEADVIHVFGTDADALEFDEGASYLIDIIVLDPGDGDLHEIPLIVWEADLALTDDAMDTISWQFTRDRWLSNEPSVEFRPEERMLVLTDVWLTPEPSACVLAVLGLLAVGLWGWRRRGR